MGLISPYPIANEFIKRAIEQNKSLSPMKLQKLIWFAFGRFLADNEDAMDVLFEEDFLVWKFGPVLRSIYVEFASFGSSNIDEYAKDAKGTILFLNHQVYQVNNLIDTIDTQWIKYQDYSGIDLSKKTHRQGTPWFDALNNKQPTIKVDDIKKFFKENLDE